jgi:Uma2 family endonuclease
MATITRRIGPADHGQRISLDEFVDADFEEGWLYELAGGVIDVTQVPGVHHGQIVRRIAALFIIYDRNHPQVVHYGAGGGECRIRLPGMQSDRHPDQAIYLTPEPKSGDIWAQWVPEIVVEVVGKGGEERDYVEKREEYLRAGVQEYWILNPETRRLLILQRAGDIWSELTVSPGETYRTRLLPGLEVRPDDLFGPTEV